MIINNKGEYTDCFAHKKNDRIGNSCNALIDWYNGQKRNNRCDKCPFFKTTEQIRKEYIDIQQKKINRRVR